MKTKILHCGQILVDRSYIYPEKSWNPFMKMGWFRGLSKKIWLPVSAYLIEHPKGLVLIDTGWNHQVRVNQREHLGFLASNLFKADLPPGQVIDEQLDKMNIVPDQLDYVVLTHLHVDHVSGLEHVKDANK